MNISMQVAGTTEGFLAACAVVAGGLVVGLMVGSLSGCRPADSTSRSTTNSNVDLAAIRPKVAAFCGDCHATPAPDTFPRDAWPEEVQQGYNFYAESGRRDLEIPPLNQVVAYYRSLAPAEWEMPALPAPSEGPLRFVPQRMPFRGQEFPAVSHVLVRSDAANGSELLWTDMREGVVGRVLLDSPVLKPETLAHIPHPAHITPTDLDKDGREDFLVADLGTYMPEDHRDGRVVWLRPKDDGAAYDPVVILENVGRVADVQVADFNADGRLDLIVAEFGWRQTGKLRMLWGAGLAAGAPQFREETLDPRHGIIHVPVADLNGDQLPDFVALVSQEHECIDAFLNRGDGAFDRRRLFAGNDPSYGSSGIQLIDIDGDQDLDILYTNGDTMDSFYLKPYHAIHWLENTGDLKFQDHVLTTMPGVYRAVGGDLDNDGDMDIAACAYIPKSKLRIDKAAEYDSLVWLEQQSPGVFARHVLERSGRGHMALDLGDVDHDGDLDIVVGGYGHQQTEDGAWLTIWNNQGAVKPAGF